MIRLLKATRNEAQDLGSVPTRPRQKSSIESEGQTTDVMGKPLFEEVRRGDVKSATQVRVL